jgi:hypothetical protein
MFGWVRTIARRTIEQLGRQEAAQKRGGLGSPARAGPERGGEKRREEKLVPRRAREQLRARTRRPAQPRVLPAP